MPACLRHASGLEPLLRATPEETKELLSAAQRLVLKEAAAGTADQRAFADLTGSSTLAQIPHDQRGLHLFDAAAVLSAPSLKATTLSIIEVSSLLVTQWISRGYVVSPERIHRAFRRHQTEFDEAALASLFPRRSSYRGKSETRMGLYRSAWKFLTKIDQTGYVLQSLTLDAQPGKLPVRMLEDLAHASGNHREAIRLRDLWYTRIKSRGQPEWYPGTFGKYATDIIQDARIPSKGDLARPRHRQSSNAKAQHSAPARRHCNAFGRSRGRLMRVDGADLYGGAAPLQPRGPPPRHRRSFAFLRVVRGSAPDELLLGIHKLVTRDLWQERPGRTKRLLWFLRLLERRTSVEVSVAVTASVGGSGGPGWRRSRWRGAAVVGGRIERHEYHGA